MRFMLFKSAPVCSTFNEPAVIDTAATLTPGIVLTARSIVVAQLAQSIPLTR
jgi:hypothetical protein